MTSATAATTGIDLPGRSLSPPWAATTLKIGDAATLPPGPKEPSWPNFSFSTSTASTRPTTPRSTARSAWTRRPVPVTGQQA
ncbi:hypothetical protein EKO23_20870 [Nocardioides guangzhouensis]|uniref:Uncharacterized protein n=1 Tax=Nocardioides guangzhouensis TaxID=2497878 RepID=A0A4Q4Z730_9ACTN|nr:hypothetical protein EKO23_20870 [Nocardioides guangzhouensis]